MTHSSPKFSAPRLSSKGGPAPEETFWTWFTDNLDMFESFEDHREWVFNSIRSQLDDISDGLAFELGRADDGVHEFIVSADGIRDRFSDVIRLVKAAPNIEGWRIIPFRPRCGTEHEIEFGGVHMDAKKIWYRLELEDDVPGLTLYIDGFNGSSTNNGDLIIGAAFIMLDMALGEVDVETKLGFVEPRPMPERPAELGLRPFHELPSDIDRVYAETVH